MIEKAKLGIERIRRMINFCGLPTNLLQLGISRDSIGEMVTSAFGIQRLLQNNVCELREEHIHRIYLKAYE
jgi:alcohol dehydrogenase class IV